MVSDPTSNMGSFIIPYYNLGGVNVTAPDIKKKD